METIEKESEILELIDTYIAQGHEVKKPLLIKLNGDFGRTEIKHYLGTKYNESILELPHIQKKFFNENGEFLSPKWFDLGNPPILFLSPNTASNDYLLNPLYACECVARYSIPFVYLAPSIWYGDNDVPASEPDLSGFDCVEYYPTINGWLMDMKSEDELPNKKRVLKSSEHHDFIKSELWDEELLCLISEQLRARLFELLLGFAESIKNNASFEDLVPNDYSEPEPAVCYLLEKLMGRFTSLFIARQIQPIAPELVDINADKSKWPICKYPYKQLTEAFSDFLANTEFAWIFDLDTPVPTAVLQETRRIIDEYKTKYGSVSYNLDERKKRNEILHKLIQQHPNARITLGSEEKE